ncbi:hypothetical protein K239x_19160 [Planctomycetes bacterium K23_9]|uniref:Uncharacterized protein n=1 Tax=Stieleria marina TaxID=1930275 RepID=A0A517NS64_9BACT|nr:hypothetical protein K239x_19160 [Planctomycetes bacterium K23_9]
MGDDVAAMAELTIGDKSAPIRVVSAEVRFVNSPVVNSVMNVRLVDSYQPPFANGWHRTK